MHSLGGANDKGVEFNLSVTAVDVSGNKIYGNIVGPGVDGTGYLTKYADEVQFYNNVAYECNVSFWLYNHAAPVRVEFKNNISLNPTQYHIYFGGNEPEGTYHIDSDYNIFYPVSGNQFHFRDESGYHDINLTQWQSFSRTNCTFDPHSIVADPLFVDPDNGDFRLQAGSPAIDAGVYVGLTQDFEGNLVPQGLAPDIGAYEYESEDKIRPGDTLPDKTEFTCYNNVFNPAKAERALIVVELPDQAHIKLGLYNTRGHRIRELADEEKEAGTHKYYWDGKSGNGDVVGSGLYFVHIHAGNYKKTKKIVVVK